MLATRTDDRTGTGCEITVPSWWAAVDDDALPLPELLRRVRAELGRHRDPESLLFGEVVADILGGLSRRRA